MRSRLLLLCLPLLAACGGDDPVAPVGRRDFAPCGTVAEYTPTAGWRSACPASVGMDSALLVAMVTEVETTMPSLQALVVARRGHIVLEGYWRGVRESTPLDLRSVTKAVTATVVANAISRGRIPSMEAPIAPYFPQYLATPDDPRKAGLTVRHLLDLSAGFEPLGEGTVFDSYAGWALTRPLAADPGTTWSYDEPLYKVLSTLVRRVDDRGMLGAARDELFRPLGIAGAARRWPVDRFGDAEGAAGLRMTARELLTLGELYRRDGMWEGAHLLPSGWTAPMKVRRDGLANDTQVWFRAWRQVVVGGHVALFALGWGGQYLVFIPDLELVVAAGADTAMPPSRFPLVMNLVRDYIVPASAAR